MQYVVDESVMDFNGLDVECSYEIIESVLDRMDDALLSGASCFYSEELFNIQVCDGLTLWDLCVEGSPVPLSYEIQARLAAIFGRLQTWESLGDHVLEDVEVRLDETIVVNARSIAWAHQKFTKNHDDLVACIVGTGRTPSGLKEVFVGGKGAELWFIGSGRDDERLYRWLIINSTSCPAELEELSPMAFKGLDFIDGAFNGIKGMSKPYRSLLPDLIKHLSALSDEGRNFFNGPWDEVDAKFGSLGVNLSDENGSTKRNGVARHERTRDWKGCSRIFWWHTKLERHQDRIHFCPDGVSRGENILIGIFCHHLTT